MGLFGPGDEQDDMGGLAGPPKDDDYSVWDSKAIPHYGKDVVKYGQNVIQPFINQYGPGTAQLFGAAQAAQKDAFDLFDEGYGNARANVGEQARVGGQQIADLTTQALASTNQAEISSGLAGGTRQGTYNRGIASDAARNIASLQASLSSIRSGLDIGEAQSKAGVASQVSNLFQGQAQSNQNELAMFLQALSGTPIKPDKDSGFGSIAGGLFGALGALAL